MVEGKSTLNPKQSSSWDNFLKTNVTQNRVQVGIIVFKTNLIQSKTDHEQRTKIYLSQRKMWTRMVINMSLDIYAPLHVYTQISFQSRNTSLPNKRAPENKQAPILCTQLTWVGPQEVLVWRTSVDLKFGAWTSPTASQKFTLLLLENVYCHSCPISISQLCCEKQRRTVEILHLAALFEL